MIQKSKQLLAKAGSRKHFSYEGGRMGKAWQDLKSEINVHVATLKAELAKLYKEDYENQTVQVLVKIKDNAKDVLVTIAHTEKLEVKTELFITLENSKNLKKRFGDLLNNFNLKVK